MSTPTQQPFPSLKITADTLEPQGAFAEAQAMYLSPDAAMVAQLDALLHEKNVGIVAHFYMDPELQGVLAKCTWPHIHVSDSLLMADSAIAMAEAGVASVIVLGVDFMSENVRAMLDAAGHPSVPVYRVTAEPIGCSLAESAEAAAYGAYLTEASRVPHALHIVYINTSLVTKAKAHGLVPTLTCTSSNVVRSVLQAAAQVPDVSVFFGPDTYMGHNLAHLFGSLAEMDTATVAALHPAHTPDTVRALAERFHYFEQGTCIVHHMFGAEVVRQVEESYPDAYVTAHLEVPGEMFALGLERQRRGAGVVGSTSDILGFIQKALQAAIAAGPGEPQTLQFVLGTEAGMITPIVREVQKVLLAARAAGGPEVAAEIVFPVSSEAIAEAPESGLTVVPGVAAGEGCSTAGGCATCPYMKMNSLRALLALTQRLGGEEPLQAYFPRLYAETIRGRTTAELGGEPILHMRAFQRSGQLPEALVADILGRNAAA
ncbi:MAG: quinolinate synthase NadA [Myxococcales bacterium]|nr:quinolinate synthase NadA [Myxococcales bacterium]